MYETYILRLITNCQLTESYAFVDTNDKKTQVCNGFLCDKLSKKQVYLYTEIQGKEGNKVCSATSSHLAGCQFLPAHLHLIEGTKQDK